MKNLLIAFAVLGCLAGFALVAGADTAHSAAKMTEITGELVDMGCYVGHAAKGMKHAECAAKCIAGGMPMGVVAGNGRIYLLTMDHANPDAYNKAKEMAGKRVKVSGPVHEKAGIKTLDVVMAELAPAAAAAK
jgi:glutamate-1-semialdehyde aminotransferase